MAIKINGDNSVANPGFTGDDTDTGLQVGTNELKLVTGGTARVTVDSAGDAEFTGKVESGPYSTSSGARLRSSGAVQIRRDGDGENVFEVYKGGTASGNINASIDSDGDAYFDGSVGAGTSSPQSRMHIHASSSNPAYFRSSNVSSGSGGTDGVVMGLGNATDVYYWNYENGAQVWATNATERMRLDSSGRFLIGHTADTAPNGYESTLQLCDTSHQGASISIRRDNGNPPALLFSSSRGTSKGVNTIVQDDDTLGVIDFYGADGTDTNTRGAQIKAAVDGTPGSNDMPGRLTFHTTADAGSNVTERMRIDSSGNVIINDTSVIGAGKLSLLFYGYSSNGLVIHNSWSGNDASYVVFRNYQGTSVGQISANQTTTTYGTSSDYRLKENVVDLDGAIDRVKQLAPKRFNFIVDADRTVDGFLAHEAQTVVPEAVTGEKDGEKMQGIDQSKLVPLLTAALKETITKIETLETQNAALAARITALETA